MLQNNEGYIQNSFSFTMKTPYFVYKIKNISLQNLICEHSPLTYYSDFPQVINSFLMKHCAYYILRTFRVSENYCTISVMYSYTSRDSFVTIAVKTATTRTRLFTCDQNECS